MSFGAMGELAHDWWHSSGYEIDFGQMFRSLITLGLAPRPWEHREAPKIRGVASLFDAASFDPGAWHNDLAGYLPVVVADRFDNFWGAKIVARFTREQIHAAVEAGRFTDPLAVEYITDTLVKRQRTTAAYWFDRVNPLDRFSVAAASDGVDLCFDDLAIVYGLVGAAPTRYAVTSYDAGGRLRRQVNVVAARDGHTCARLELAASSGDSDYTMFRISTERSRFTGQTIVHVARELGAAAPRVIGLWRL
jgi:hypothetical protein